MSKEDYIPRLSIPIRIDQKRDLEKLVPYGLQARIYREITDDLIRLLKSSKKEVFLAMLLSDEIGLENFSTAFNRIKKNED